MDNNQIQKILKLRESFKHDLKYCKNPDKDTRLILTAKIVAIGQVLEVIGYEEPLIDLNEILKQIHD